MQAPAQAVTSTRGLLDSRRAAATTFFTGEVSSSITMTWTTKPNERDSSRTARRSRDYLGLVLAFFQSLSSFHFDLLSRSCVLAHFRFIEDLPNVAAPVSSRLSEFIFRCYQKIRSIDIMKEPIVQDASKRF